jgi:hypothetical protein
MRARPSFVCFDMATPGRVVWVIVRFFLVVIGAVAVLAITWHPGGRTARPAAAMPAAQAPGPQLDHATLGDKPKGARP